jgi:hypothetical protein
MFRFILKKTRLHPVSSLVISFLIFGITIFESSVISFEEDSSAKKSNSQITATEQYNNQPKASSTNLPPDDLSITVEADVNLEKSTHRSIKEINPSLAHMLANKDFGALRDELLKLAAVAVSENDKNRLGYILNLLGQVSIQDQDVYSAEVYLLEALDIFTGLNDEIGTAQINLQLGRTHLKSRQIARVAGTAYDELQVGRWYLSHNIQGQAEQYIRKSIERNLSINRYGSAASAYESLTKLFLKENNWEQARVAAFESAKMFASSGNSARSDRVLKLISNNTIQDWQFDELKIDLAKNYQSYKQGVLQIERSKDYRRLYHFYKNQGDNERAWKFRLLANNSLSQVSKRTLFHRQQGVLAILFNSNDDVDMAEDYFVKAKATFKSHGLKTLSEETENLGNQIL